MERAIEDVADTANHRVLEYDAPLSSDTVPDRVFGQLGTLNRNNIYPPSPDSLDLPAGLALDSNNNLYLADSANNRVLEFSNRSCPSTPTGAHAPTPTPMRTPTVTAERANVNAYIHQYSNDYAYSDAYADTHPESDASSDRYTTARNHMCRTVDTSPNMVPGALVTSRPLPQSRDQKQTSMGAAECVG